jgi:hypothetical protein
MRPLLVVLMTIALGCGPVVPGDDDDDGGVWGQEALDFVTDNLVGTFAGAWTLWGLDAADAQVERSAWTDSATGSDPRIDGDRALVDISNVMDGGTWTQEMEFFEGVYIEEDGSMGSYFFEIDSVVTLLTESSPGVWEYDSPIISSDYSTMVNVTADNLVTGSKHSTKVISFPGGVEHHQITGTMHVEYDAGAGLQVVDFVNLDGYHDRSE